MKTAYRAETDELEAERIAAIKRGIADADAGRIVPYEKVRSWLLSLGTDQELPMPKPECK